MFGRTRWRTIAPIQAAVIQILDSPNRKAGAKANQNSRPPKEGSSTFKAKKLSVFFRDNSTARPAQEISAGMMKSTRFLIAAENQGLNHCDPAVSARVA